MPFKIQTQENRLLLALSGSLTIYQAQQLSESLKEFLFSNSKVSVQTKDLKSIDTCILQLLVSLKKTAPEFNVQDPSIAFLSAVDRSGLRRELIPDYKEAA